MEFFVSAYVYLTSPDNQQAFLLADGAGYSDDGIVRNISTKIEIGKIAPIAITATGNADLADRIKRFLIDQADRVGVEEFMETVLPAFLIELQVTYDTNGHKRGQEVCVAIAGWSTSLGAFRATFQTFDEPDRPEIRAFEIAILRDMSFRGGNFPPERLAEIRMPGPGEHVRAFMRYLGKELITFMRETASVPVHLKSTGAEAGYWIGGHVDMATVDQDGARIERIHFWPDRIGERIDPSRRQLNRAERRRLAA